MESWEGHACFACARTMFGTMQWQNWLMGWFSGPLFLVLVLTALVGNRHWLNQAIAVSRTGPATPG